MLQVISRQKRQAEFPKPILGQMAFGGFGHCDQSMNFSAMLTSSDHNISFVQTVND
jgi:hypothetical protein